MIVNKIVSVIVPVYKVEKYLSKCIDSILNQTYSNLEIILVDDESPDHCGAICDEYAKKDSRIKVIHKENGGLSDARNAGIDVASGEYLMFVDSDDWIDCNAIEVLYQRMRQDCSDMAVGSVICTDEADNLIKDSGSQWQLSDATYDLEKFSNEIILHFPMACSKLYRTEFFKEIRFPVGKVHEDEFVVHRLAGRCKTISTVSNIVYFYRQREGSIMSEQNYLKRLDAIEAWIDRIIFYSEQSLISAMQKTFLHIMIVMPNIVSHINLKNKENQKYVKKLYSDIKKLYYMKLKSLASFSVRLRFTIFSLSPNLYIKIISIYAKLRNSFR